MMKMPHLLCVEWRTVINPLRPNKGMSVFWVTGLKILGSVGSHIFFLLRNHLAVGTQISYGVFIRLLMSLDQNGHHPHIW